MSLTDLEIRRAKPAEKTYTKSDGNGLSLQIESNGSKGWRFRYRFEGKAKMLSLGTYPRCPYLKLAVSVMKLRSF
ncbi:Arm DNA-binding domain-containing protein [Serratia proteamaculans]|jgi:hypothetical protein|uniref:Arm DNA-binding domain-containing protein n=1 Tax=Serratia proteamaculans TaxID=28151 RepID=UPI002179C4F4|nr:Putative prophage CPS-53 integrase [Serratia proteamaculans]CAI1113565.1 Putative prophage CPS-53 integrase [Serratia proteamaculans]CAI1210708.1 Putative prophage CPS-53 integrase [Serratia proteamaculans]